MVGPSHVYAMRPEAERLLELDPATLRDRAGNAARERPGTWLRHLRRRVG